MGPSFHVAVPPELPCRPASRSRQQPIVLVPGSTLSFVPFKDGSAAPVRQLETSLQHALRYPMFQYPPRRSSPPQSTVSPRKRWCLHCSSVQQIRARGSLPPFCFLLLELQGTSNLRPHSPCPKPISRIGHYLSRSFPYRSTPWRSNQHLILNS